LYNLLTAEGAVIGDETNMGDNYTAHITNRSSDLNLTGAELPFDTIDVVEALDKKRKSIFRFDFKR